MDINEFLEIGQIRCKMDVYKRKKQNAIEVCVQQLETHREPYLALSGGKDSVAMSFIVDEAARQCGRDFRIWSHVSDASFPGTVETIQRVAEMTDRQLDSYESSTSAFDYLNKKEKQAFGKAGAFFDSIREYAKDKDLAFVGVRAAESKRRHKAAMAHGQVFHSDSMGNVDVCHPLLWFTLEDVSAALYEYHAPIHPIYYKAPIGTKHGSEYEFIRLGYITSKDLLNKGTAVFLKLNYPEQYAKLAEAWPDVKRFT